MVRVVTYFSRSKIDPIARKLRQFEIWVNWRKMGQKNFFLVAGQIFVWATEISTPPKILQKCYLGIFSFKKMKNSRQDENWHSRWNFGNFGGLKKRQFLAIFDFTHFQKVQYIPNARTYARKIYIFFWWLYGVFTTKKIRGIL